MVSHRYYILLIQFLFETVLFDVLEKAFFIRNLVVFSQMIVNEQLVHNKFSLPPGASAVDRLVIFKEWQSILITLGTKWWRLPFCSKSLGKYWAGIWMLPITKLTPDQIGFISIWCYFQVDSSSDELVDETGIVAFFYENLKLLFFLIMDSTYVVTGQNTFQEGSLLSLLLLEKRSFSFELSRSCWLFTWSSVHGIFSIESGTNKVENSLFVIIWTLEVAFMFDDVVNGINFR